MNFLCKLHNERTVKICSNVNCKEFLLCDLCDHSADCLTSSIDLSTIDEFENCIENLRDAYEQVYNKNLKEYHEHVEQFKENLKNEFISILDKMLENVLKNDINHDEMFGYRRDRSIFDGPTFNKFEIFEEMHTNFLEMKNEYESENSIENKNKMLKWMKILVNMPDNQMFQKMNSNFEIKKEELKQLLSGYDEMFNQLKKNFERFHEMRKSGYLLEKKKNFFNELYENIDVEGNIITDVKIDLIKEEMDLIKFQKSFILNKGEFKETKKIQLLLKEFNEKAQIEDLQLVNLYNVFSLSKLVCFTCKPILKEGQFGKMKFTPGLKKINNLFAVGDLLNSKPSSEYGFMHFEDSIKSVKISNCENFIHITISKNDHSILRVNHDKTSIKLEKIKIQICSEIVDFIFLSTSEFDCILVDKDGSLIYYSLKEGTIYRQLKDKAISKVNLMRKKFIFASSKDFIIYLIDFKTGEISFLKKVDHEMISNLKTNANNSPSISRFIICILMLRVKGYTNNSNFTYFKEEVILWTVKERRFKIWVYLEI